MSDEDDRINARLDKLFGKPKLAPRTRVPQTPQKIAASRPRAVRADAIPDPETELTDMPRPFLSQATAFAAPS